MVNSSRSKDEGRRREAENPGRKKPVGEVMRLWSEEDARDDRGNTRSYIVNDAPIVLDRVRGRDDDPTKIFVKVNLFFSPSASR